MLPEDIDAAIRAGWLRNQTLDPCWHSPTVFIGPWVRTAYITGNRDAEERITQLTQELQKQMKLCQEAQRSLVEWMDYCRSWGIGEPKERSQR